MDDAGAVDEHVDTAVGGDHGVDGTVAEPGIADVADDHRGPGLVHDPL